MDAATVCLFIISLRLSILLTLWNKESLLENKSFFPSTTENIFALTFLHVVLGDKVKFCSEKNSSMTTLYGDKNNESCGSFSCFATARFHAELTIKYPLVELK